MFSERAKEEQWLEETQANFIGREKIQAVKVQKLFLA